jgi:hypothetical protein
MYKLYEEDPHDWQLLRQTHDDALVVMCTICNTISYREWNSELMEYEEAFRESGEEDPCD